jgi:hypothetical protein
LIQESIRLSKLFVLAICCLVLTKDSEAKPSIEKVLVMADTGSEVLVAKHPEVSAPFQRSEWLSDHGSGRFPEDFSDEHRRMDKWETDPNQ